VSNFQERLIAVRQSSETIFKDLNENQRIPTPEEVTLLRMMGWEVCEDAESLASGWLVNMMKWNSSTWSTKKGFSVGENH
jgi:hypothetical protein